jgi:hypothetical protein
MPNIPHGDGASLIFAQALESALLTKGDNLTQAQIVAAIASVIVAALP